MNNNTTYSKGERAQEEGEYICVPCGFKKRYTIGEPFGECTSCLAGTSDGDKDYVEGTGMWEKIVEDKKE